MARTRALALAALAVLPLTTCQTTITARDGFGNQVDWFFILKLPNGTFPASELWKLEVSGGRISVNDLDIGSQHCNCPDPSCDGMPYPEYGAGRGSGLCYLYADSNNSTLRYFTDVTNDKGEPMECLGQGGNDPLSQTMRQLQNEDAYSADDVEWAIWNDELQALADSYDADVCAYSSYSDEGLPYTPCSTDADCGLRCSGSPYEECTDDADCSSGTCKQISCKSRELPQYANTCGSPYGHSKGALAYEKDSTGFFLQATTPNWPDPSQRDVFVPLGCQLDNNAYLSQSFMGVTLEADTFSDIAKNLESARLCSTGTLSCRNGSAGHLIDFNCTSEQTRGEDWSILDTAFSGNSNAGMHSNSATVTTPGGVDVSLIVHSSEDAVPPWMVVADELEVDLGVASWWDYNYGFASICAGDDYSATTNNMCLVSEELGLSLNSEGGAAYSLENAIAASFVMNGQDLAWGLWGDFTSIASHAKFGTAASWDFPWVVSGDENNQGWSCSTSCTGSQNGRGGLFWAINDADLHASMYSTLKTVCACNSFSVDYKRFCNFGCSYKNTTASMPIGPSYLQQSSFWDADNKAWIP